MSRETAASAAPRIRGVCWEAGPQVLRENLAPLRDLGSDWISQTPFGWQPAVDRPELRMITASHLGFGPMWGETDSGLARTTRLARSLGIHSMLKPHLWLRGGEWCGTIRMKNEADWAEWFRRYQDFAVHYARLAEAQGMEIYAVGTELKGTAGREADWRRLIAEVRKVYHGRLTYSANWDGELDSVRFWDALDYIGVQAYYPLSDKDHPTLMDLESGWAPFAQGLEETARRWNRPILFTEVGYKSSEGAARRPWEWEAQGPNDPVLQSNCYEALFASLWGRPWFAGLFLWKWHPTKRWDPGSSGGDFSPQEKPAAVVARRWFHGPG